MRSMLSTAAALAIAATGVTAGSHSSLEGTLRIISDMSNPAPRAVMEGLAAEFDEMHPKDICVTGRNLGFSGIWSFVLVR